MKIAETSHNIIELRKRGRPPRDIQTILDAAASVFAREGYAAATIEMIASEAAASTATLYKRFTNKHGLFVAVLEQTTAQALELHVKNRIERPHAFGGIINRLEAHGEVCSDTQMRGVMRAWIGEARSQGELADLFAVRSGQEMVTGLKNQLKKLADSGLISIGDDFDQASMLAAQLMLGIVERFTLTRGLILGDSVPPLFTAAVVAEKAVHAMIGIWGTPAGLEAFKQIPSTPVQTVGPCK